VKFTFSKRPAQIGPSINTRTEKHGEENVPGVDIPVSGIFLTKEEINILLQDEDAYDALYTDTRSKQLEPRFMTIEPIRLSDKFTGARVTIAVNGEDLVLKPAKISKISLAPQVGGLTLMSCTVQGNPSDHTDVLALLNLKCRIQILGAALEEPAPAEPELPLDHEGQAAPADSGFLDNLSKYPVEDIIKNGLKNNTVKSNEEYSSPLARKIAAMGKKTARKGKRS
jgi:hypothetical protein